MASKPFYEFLRDFAESLPASYRERHAAAAVADHARLAWSRRSSASVGAFRCTRGDGAALCVIADDRPGLLARISAAFVVCGIDVVSAEAYTRSRDDGRNEAIDLFWVRSAVHGGKNLSQDELSRAGRVLVSLLDGSEVPESAPVAPTPPIGRGSSRVSFKLERGQIGAVDVETLDRPGLLYALTAAIFGLRLQIVSSELRTIHGRAFDRFVVRELDGAPVNAARQAELRDALLGAIGSAETGSAFSAVPAKTGT